MEKAKSDAAKRGVGELNLAEPPRRYYGWRIKPMRAWECDIVVESYNEWARKWNHHELSRDLPLSPDWDFARMIQLPRVRAQSALIFETNNAGRIGIVKVRDWRHWIGDGLFSRKGFCRRLIKPEHVIWAAWREPSKLERVR